MNVSRFRTFQPLYAIVAIVVSLAVLVSSAPAGSPAGDTLQVSGYNFPDDYGRPTIDEDMPANGVDDVFDFTMGAGLPVVEGVTTQVGGMNWTINAIDFPGTPGGITVSTPPGNPLTHTVFENPGKLIEITFDEVGSMSGSFANDKFSRWGMAVEDLQYLDMAMVPETDPLIVWDSTLYFYPRSGTFDLDPSPFQTSFTIGPHPTNPMQNVIYLNVQDAAALSIETVFADGTAMFAIQPKQTDLLEAGSLELGLFTIPIDGLTAGILVSRTLAGDANLDFDVGVADYTSWANGFFLDNPTFQEGDFNGDGNTDPADYTLWANNFGLTPPSPGPVSQAVPEPATLGMLALGFACLAAGWLGQKRSGCPSD